MSLDLTKQQANAMLTELLAIKKAAMPTRKALDNNKSFSWFYIAFHLILNSFIVASGFYFSHASYGDIFVWNVPMDIVEVDDSFNRYISLHIQVFLSAFVMLGSLLRVLYFYMSKSLTSGFYLAKSLSSNQTSLVRGAARDFLKGDDRVEAERFIQALFAPENVHANTHKSEFVEYLTARNVVVNKVIIDAIFGTALDAAIASVGDYISDIVGSEPSSWRRPLEV